MKAFLAEYGKTIMVAVVIMALIGVANYFTGSSADDIKEFVNTFDNSRVREYTIANPTTTYFADAGSNGAEYTFTLTDGTEVSAGDADFSAADLSCNVAGYSVVGDNSTPRFYMYDMSLKVNRRTWQTVATEVSEVKAANTGKKNTDIMLKRSDRGTAFDYIAELNSGSGGGYSDWFMGSMAEYDMFAVKPQAYFWSSVDYGAFAYYYAQNVNRWALYGKKDPFYGAVIPMRAF